MTSSLASRFAGRKQDLANRRVDELVLIQDADQILTTYEEIDRDGDSAFVTAAKAHYRTLTDHEQQQTWARAMALWLADESAEEQVIRRAHEHNGVQELIHHSNTPAFLGEAPTGIPAELIDRQQQART